MDNKALTQKIFRTATAFAVVFGIVIFIYVLGGFAPFGDMSFTYRDGDIQMLDFLRCFKRFLQGDGSMLYSFSKGLGDNMYPLFTYYLASPVNLLVFFFSYDSIPAFVNIAAAIKLASAAAAFSFYVESRYDICDNKRMIFSLLLSVSYGLCSFGITAGCFLPFLEGLVFMPLFAAGVHKAVCEGKRITLIVSCALSIIFSWFMGALCCLYSVVILFVELFAEQRDIKTLIRSTLRYAYCMAMGILISTVVLLPTLNALGSHGGVDVKGFMIPDLVGNPLSFITNYKILSMSDLGSPAIFAGSFVFIATVAFFASRRPARQKIVYGIALFFTVAIFHFRPLINLYLLLHENTAFVYGYRYAYAASFLLCMMSAELILSLDKNGLRPVAVFVSGSLLATLVLSSDLISGNTQVTGFSVGLIALITAVGTFMASKKIRNDLRKTFAGILIVVCLLESSVNAYTVLPLYSLPNADSYSRYEQDAEKFAASLPKDGQYRVTRTTFRENNLYPGLTCCYNDPLAYGYMGLSSYSSAQSDRAGSFLDRAGYPYSASTMSIVNSPNLAVDSLLGVRYIMTDYNVAELLPAGLSDYESLNVYQNHYAADIAFVVPSEAKDRVKDPVTGEDYFDYMNEVWSRITGTEAKVFVPAEYETTDEEGIRSYKITPSEGNFLYYGYMTAGNDTGVMLDVNSKYETAYSNWVAPSVFLIPEAGEEDVYEVKVTQGSESISKAVFAKLDLDELERVSKILQDSDGVTVHKFEGRHMVYSVEAKQQGYLCITVPYDEQWTLKVNGRLTEPALFADTFFLIPIEEGKNTIQLDYNVRYLAPSLAVSIIAVLVVVTAEVSMYMRRREDKEKSGEQK